MTRLDHPEFDAYLDDAAGDGRDGEGPFAAWWAHVPDYMLPDYPFDIPPRRLPFAQTLFTEVGAPRFCPEPACRRAGSCQGGDGPPCYRADKDALTQILLLWWMRTYTTLSEEQCAHALRAHGNRYAPPDGPAPHARRRTRRGR